MLGSTISSNNFASFEMYSDADYTMYGSSINDEIGRVFAPAGDIDGDNLSDILVVAMYNDYGGTNTGTAYLLGGILAPFGGKH